MGKLNKDSHLHIATSMMASERKGTKGRGRYGIAIRDNLGLDWYEQALSPGGVREATDPVFLSSVFLSLFPPFPCL